MIGGTDIYFTISNENPFEEAIEVIKSFWPDAIVEHEAEERFIYPNQKAKESWDRDGVTNDNDKELIHLIWRKIKLSEFTVVIDAFQVNRPIVDAIYTKLTGLEAETLTLFRPKKANQK